MRFLGYTLGDDSTPSAPPTPEIMAQMGQFVEGMTASGHLIATGAFAPIAMGTVKVSLTGGEFTVTDGPFTEAKELIGGWALTEFDTVAEAIENTKKFLTIAGGGESTIRRIFGPEDFPPGFDPTALAANAAADGR
ncbi:hypothetical protein ABIB25_002984 [Nakamurella sp. UYEF19]|uniref:YciI family protein n=1 Tax=Nakamurella sp. UYEF19 TaxID=1756392 RepID=UPI003391EB43